MPRKKKSNLNAVTRASKQKKVKRLLEDSAHRKKRLGNNRKRVETLRKNETDEQRKCRQNYDRFMHARLRSNESLEEHHERLSNDRERHFKLRMNETIEQRMKRVNCDREQHTFARSIESDDQRAKQLAHDRDHHSQLRLNETHEQRTRRLSIDRDQHAFVRSIESDDHRAMRLAHDCDHHSQLRLNETHEHRTQRLSNDRDQHVFVRSIESNNHRAMRLSHDREHHRITRELESDVAHESRKAKVRERYQTLRNEREIRLRQNQNRIENLRGNESNTQRQERLLTDAQRHSLNRQLESEQEHQQRLEADCNRQMQRRLIRWQNKLNSGFSYNPLIDYKHESHIGSMTIVCPDCKAIKFKRESRGLCCSSGKVSLDPINPPEPIKSLLSGTNAQSKIFFKSIRGYNNAFQMTSFGANIISEGNFMPTFKVQGQVYHLIGSLLPEKDKPSQFLQIYFISDYNEQANVRLSHFQNLNRNLIMDIQNCLHEVNPYVRDFKTALESIPINNINNYNLIINADRKPASGHPGCYNEPTTNEVAVLLVDQQYEKRDIVLSTRNGELKRICETHRSYDALQYPLMFVRGEDGYNFGIQTSKKKITALQFYSYRVMVKHDEFNSLHRYKQLFNQFLVDMYAKIESERLLFIRINQKQLRAENYIHLQDAIQSDKDIENLGRLVILPSSYTGGPRYMHERTQDAFCYVKKHGRPDLFITFTTNPNWEEITEQLYEGQSSSDRQDIISRVFHLKLKNLIDLLTKGELFGPVKCYIYSVEFQKRGLPHAHILLWLEKKLQSDDIDNVIKAEFPNPQEDPELFKIVKKHMVHGPCGPINFQSVCMKNGQCTKRFPKKFVNETLTNEDGYPTYKRRSPEMGGAVVMMKVHGNDIEIDNRWVVPYSPVLLRTFDCHINVEFCSSVKSIKYVCKYINKGSDQATFGLKNENDEITRYQSGRYISSSEAVWRILSFPIHERFPPVVHLDVHLENGQRIYFNPVNLNDQIENPKNTTLMAFFKLCQEDDFAKTLLYDEVPSYYIFDKQSKIFNKRKRGRKVDGYADIFQENVIGRVYTIHPSNTECYYLRLLLHNVRGPRSFEDLKTIENIIHPTYQAACKALNLIEDDSHWDETLKDASLIDSPQKIRQLFAIILVFCNPSEPMELWMKYKEYLSEDYLRSLMRNFPDTDSNQYTEEIENRCLLDLNDLLISIGGNSLNHYGLPTPTMNNASINNREYLEEMNYNQSLLSTFLLENEPKLNEEQKKIFDEVIHSVDASKGDIFFIDAPGGTGKTFLINLILAKVRNSRKIALAVASSGIAATLLPGGKTAHSMFKIPINLDLNECPVCNVSKNSNKAELLQNTCLIVWDECTMAHKKAIEAVDRTLQDLRNTNKRMGGITFLFSGDFRQTLPVVVRGTRADELNASLRQSYIWNDIKKLTLSINMRVKEDSSALEFSRLLLNVGEGKLTENPQGEISLPTGLCKIVSSLDNLIEKIYPDINDISKKDNAWFSERAILGPTNEIVKSINSFIIEKFNAAENIYASINTTVNQDDLTNYPVEFLNSLSASGLPDHKIKLKVGAPIILLRNLNPPKLCNGTRLRVTRLMKNIIEATILTGSGSGESVFIPRIPLIPTNYPFEFKRIQFPVGICLAMTINKSQGQTLKTAGVDLRTNCFSHGQLYVAVSRVSSSVNLYVLSPNGITRNVVYSEAFN